MIANHRGCGGVCEQNDYIMDGYWICSRCGEIVDGNDLGSWWDNAASNFEKVAKACEIGDMLPAWRSRIQQGQIAGIEQDLIQAGIRIEELPVDLQGDIETVIQQERHLQNLLRQRNTLINTLEALR
jgi:hypothetical protein